MTVTCPHCQHHIEIVEVDPEAATKCPECGSSLMGVLETRSLKADEIRLVHGFELQERVGAGTFGEVWKAYDRRLDRIVALKLPRTQSLDREDIGSFVRESQAAAQLRHPNIVTVYDIIQEDNRVVVVSEFIDGFPLHEYLRVNKFSARDSAELVATLCEALHAAHSAGVVHRDLKPANILLDGNRRPHLTDFGLAKREGDVFTIAVDGKVLGTPGYMSPEQAAGRGHDADCRSDVYSVGVILYELLVGRRPFVGGSRLLIHQIQHDDPKPPRSFDRSIPRDLETICLKALEKVPARRYATAAEMADDLRRFLRAEPIHARPVGHLERTARWCYRNPAWATAAAVLTTAIGIIFSLAWSHQQANSMAEKKERELQQAIEQKQQQNEDTVAKLQEAEQNAPKRRRVLLETEPPGANLVFYPIDVAAGVVAVDKKVTSTGEQPINLIPGAYLVVAYLPNGDFHEVFRYVPVLDKEMDQRYYRHQAFRIQDGAVHWESVRIVSMPSNPEGMARIPGTDNFLQGEARGRQMILPEFFLDCSEVTVAAFRTAWPKHRALATNKNPDDFPMTGVTLDDAIAYAEMVGKILPDETMFEYAATNFGRSRFPWGDAAEEPPAWEISPVGSAPFDRLASDPSVVVLFSNCLEWVSTGPPTLILRGDMVPLGNLTGIVRGGPSSALTDQPAANWDNISGRSRFVRDSYKKHDSLGFRCARSVKPRLGANDFVRPVVVTE